jgi:hypothetical protein
MKIVDVNGQWWLTARAAWLAWIRTIPKKSGDNA